MADTLIETVASNPYEGIVADTSTQISNLDAQIQQLTDAINKLERLSPTSPTLPQLRERLSNLQGQREGLSQTNSSAMSLSQSFSQGAANVSTLKGIYDIKQQELERSRNQDDAAYRKMYEDTQRQSDNYINALQNATTSENAIINANAGKQGASSQSTAEARARNYLAAAAQGNEAANTARQQLNAIEEGRINSNQGYVQLSQNNADNYLRQQVLNDYQSAEAEKERQFQRELNGLKSGSGSSYSGGGSRSSGGGGGGGGGGGNPDIVDPYEEFQNPETPEGTNTGYPTLQEIIAEFDKQGTSPTYEAVKTRNPNITEQQFLKGMNDNFSEYQTTLTDEKINAITDSYNRGDMSLEDYGKQLIELENQQKQEKSQQKKTNNTISNIETAKNLYLENLRRFGPDSRYTQGALQYYNQLKGK